MTSQRNRNRSLVTGAIAEIITEELAAGRTTINREQLRRRVTTQHLAPHALRSAGSAATMSRAYIDALHRLKAKGVVTWADDETIELLRAPQKAADR